jgi:phosphoribosyl-AMP cyclohydrolase
MHQLMTFNRHLLPPWLKLNILITSTDTPEAGSDYLSAVMRLVKDFDHQIQSFILGSTSLSSTAQEQDCESAAQLAASWIYGLMQSDRPDNLLPTIVVNRQQQALGLVYSSRESLQAALRSGTGVYYSRSRQQLWEKGKTSGATQRLHRIDFDCDRDALRFEVTQLEPGMLI